MADPRSKMIQSSPADQSGMGDVSEEKVDTGLLAKLLDFNCDESLAQLLMIQIHALSQPSSHPWHDATISRYIELQRKQADEFDADTKYLDLWSEIHQIIKALRTNNLEALAQHLRKFYDLIDSEHAYTYDLHLIRLAPAIISQVAGQFPQLSSDDRQRAKSVYVNYLLCMFSLASYETLTLSQPDSLLAEMFAEDFLKKCNSRFLQMPDLALMLEDAYASALEIIEGKAGLRSVYMADRTILGAYLDLCLRAQIPGEYLKLCLYDTLLKDPEDDQSQVEGDKFSSYFDSYEVTHFLAQYYEKVERNSFKARAVRSVYEIITINQNLGLDAEEKEEGFFDCLRSVHRCNDKLLEALFRKVCRIVVAEECEHLRGHYFNVALMDSLLPVIDSPKIAAPQPISPPFLELKRVPDSDLLPVNSTAMNGEKFFLSSVRENEKEDKESSSISSSPRTTSSSSEGGDQRNPTQVFWHSFAHLSLINNATDPNARPFFFESDGQEEGQAKRCKKSSP